MLISIVQVEVFLSEAEAHRSKWASTANWKGRNGNNIEVDLLQQNVNRDLKKSIKGMGANKTVKAIERLSRAIGGLREIILNFDNKTGKKRNHHRTATNNQRMILVSLYCQI